MPRKTPAAAGTTAATTARRRTKAAAGAFEPEHVATRAYYIHLETGGEALENWLQAERELLPAGR